MFNLCSVQHYDWFWKSGVSVSTVCTAELLCGVYVIITMAALQDMIVQYQLGEADPPVLVIWLPMIKSSKGYNCFTHTCQPPVHISPCYWFCDAIWSIFNDFQETKVVVV